MMRIFLKKYYLLAFSIFLMLNSYKIYSQNISLLTDYLGNVEVFDNGKFKQIEYKPLRSYQVGNNAIAYEDNAGNFKIYYNDFVRNVGVFVDDYACSNGLIAFSYRKVFKVFDDGDIKLLSLSALNYYVGTNIIVWYDNAESKVKAYYQKKIYDLDDALMNDTITPIYGANNIAAYFDSRDYLNIFYNEDIYPVELSERVSDIKAGKNLIAFIDENNSSFQTFYYGELTEVENFKPISYKTGDNFIAYIDANGYFKVFRDFNVATLDINTPSFFEIKNNIMVFGVQNYFKAYIGDKLFTLETILPEQYIVNNNVCAYIDQRGALKYFNGEKTETVSYEKIKKFELTGNILKFSYGINSESLYWNGKIYNND
ncbi:MAG: hypothetical protein LBV69_09370 [Bacteroidales bacterium]|jgi:hypothetical protein|nr:hypothetical protein [Bacteroidales bacterium]